MKRTLALLLLCAPVAAVEVPTQLAKAMRAMSEGLPEVAIARLKTALDDRTFPKVHRAQAARLLAEAHLAANEPKQALAVLQTVPESPEPEWQLLRANVETANSQWANAFRRYQELSQQPNVPIAASLGEVECLQALGRTAEAVAKLRKIVAKDKPPVVAQLRLASLYIELGRAKDARNVLTGAQVTESADLKWLRNLEGRILLLENAPKEALEKLEALVADRVGLSPNLHAAATLAIAEARLALGGPDQAAKTLESFIRQNPESPQLELIFRRLDQVYKLDKNPAEGPLHGFFTDLPPRASALAQFYVTRLQLREKRFDRARTSLEIFLKKFPQHPLVPFAYRMQADLAMESKDLSGAERALEAASRSTEDEELRAELALSAALVNLYQREFVRAATRLKDAESFPRLRKTAAYNAALGWLMQQNYARFREELTSFAAQFHAPTLIGQLRLEEGLMQARMNNSEAGTTLHAFLREFPDHLRGTEAKIALAELAYEGGRQHEAMAMLAAAKESATAPPDREQAEYLAIFLADRQSPKNVAEVTRLAREFLAKHPRSSRAAEVRMKLGQVYFQEEDYLKAQEQFETVATAEPTGTYAEMALFFAGQCGMKLINTEALNHAVELFDKVAERKGTLEKRARLQQAIVKNKLGAEEDAVKIYDSIITAPTTTEPEVRYAALIGRADNLVGIAQKPIHADDPAARERFITTAIQSYDTLLQTADAPPTWRNQAAYKKGKALMQMGRAEDALVVFSDVLDRTTPGERESFWYAKAGFEAASLLEAKKSWKSAVSLYEKMARVPGQHVAQARQRVKTLRLEHFLWD
jgi:TolA-binding protein/predicted negative regulator of RcsB-dependent stress response